MIGGLVIALIWVGLCSPTFTSLSWEFSKVFAFGPYGDEVIREREKWYRISFPFMWKHGAPLGAGGWIGLGVVHEFGLRETEHAMILYPVGGAICIWMLAEAWRMIQVKPTEPPEVL